MRIAKALTALLLAAVIMISAASCSFTKEWAVKKDDTEYSIGVYIFYLRTAYFEAREKVADNTKDILTQTIEEDGKNVPAEEWIVNKAKKYCDELIGTEKLYYASGLTISDDDENSISQQANIDWVGNPDPYQYAPALGPTYEGYGISKDSYASARWRVFIMKQRLFNTTYGAGGKKAVSEQEIKDYFLKNYTSYSYMQVPLYTEATNEDGTSKKTAMTAEEIKKVEESLNKYLDDINKSGKRFKKIVNDYMDANSSTSDPSTSAVELLDGSSAPEDVIKAVKELENSKAKLIKVGTNENALYYLVYKRDIKKDIGQALQLTQRNEILDKIKTDEFNKELTSYSESLKSELNTSAFSKYKPSMFKKETESSQ